MSKESLDSIVKTLLISGKGILAADESASSIKKKLEKAGVEDTFENHRAYREIFFTTPDMEKYISGVIMFDETIRQTTKDGVPFAQVLVVKGVIPGIKVDQGTVALDGSSDEVVTVGLDGLDERLKEYYILGARFAKWRAIIKIGASIPTEKCVNLNMQELAKYAKLCQDNQLVPIVEPEVLMDGDHTIDKCFEVTKKIQTVLFSELKNLGVDLSGLLLKPNMVMYSSAGAKVSASVVAEKTLECFNQTVPAEVPGIVFLSGGQSEPEACENLNAIAKLAKQKNAPWKFSFSFGRALQNTALKTWAGKAENFAAAQQAFLQRAQLASAATRGEYQE